MGVHAPAPHLPFIGAARQGPTSHGSAGRPRSGREIVSGRPLGRPWGDQFQHKDHHVHMQFIVALQPHLYLILPQKSKHSPSSQAAHFQGISKPQGAFQPSTQSKNKRVSDKNTITGQCSSQKLRISRTTSGCSTPGQVKHKIFIVPGGGCLLQPPPILHLVECSVSSASLSTHSKQQHMPPPYVHPTRSLLKTQGQLEHELCFQYLAGWVSNVSEELGLNPFDFLFLCVS